MENLFICITLGCEVHFDISHNLSPRDCVSVDVDFCPTADVNLVKPFVPHMLQFISHIAVDEDHSDSVIAASCGLIG